MKVQSNHFIQLADIAIADPNVQAAVAKGTQTAVAARLRAMSETNVEHGQTLRRQAAAIKRATLNRLPELLEQAESNMQANGITVLWAANAAEARQHVLHIAQKHQVTKVTKSKSMVTEEIALNEALEQQGITAIETDLGEYILQLNQEAPSHIVTPVIHKTKESIQQIFADNIGMPPTEDAEEMAQYVREQIREQFLSADMGISGANFLIAETGSICLVTNEGNGSMVTTLPDIHVAVTGIEKIVATVEDYATLTQVLPRSATGQKMTVYTNMVNGPRREGESDGPQHVYVVLVDNGRSQIFASEYAEALACIRCGACLNICPVYAVTGGHSYGWVYPGPIGSIVTPLLSGLENATPLPYASSLCGACKQACPVDIDIPRMLLDLRRDLVESRQSASSWNIGLKLWAYGMTSPTRYALGDKAIATITSAYMPRNLPGPLSGWTKYRAAPKFDKKPFRDRWRERQNQEEDTDE
ncbi:MAG: iron-sulfur cluster-binding protein [Anaerolineaceae bacterium]|nr:MAG: iron-sulfur cluster-binding protein [Anaerolineaceae bacterium]